MKRGSSLGVHRVIEPKASLPQAAKKLDNTPEIYDNEILIDVEMLHITSASFLRIEKEVGTGQKELAEVINQIVKERGKYQDPVLGCGGMLVGGVAQIGDTLIDRVDLRVGDRIATLVSLTLTPLKLENIKEINPDTGQVRVDGKAVLFESGIYTRLPADLPEELSLTLMDVAGAPAMVSKKVKAGDVVLIIGGGKAGLLCLHEAKKRSGVTGKVICIAHTEKRRDDIKRLGLADAVISLDVTKPVEVMERVSEITKGEMADFTVNVVNVENSEMSTILCTKDTGLIYFFNMATSFSKAALGAEGVGKTVQMLIGNGYVKGHAEIAFQIIRENPPLREFFEKTYLPKIGEASG